MDKKLAIELLGGSLAEAGRRLDRSRQALWMWEEDLTPDQERLVLGELVREKIGAERFVEIVKSL